MIMRVNRHRFLKVAAIAALSLGLLADSSTASTQRGQWRGGTGRTPAHSKFVAPKVNRGVSHRHIVTPVTRRSPHTPTAKVTPRTAPATSHSGHDGSRGVNQGPGNYRGPGRDRGPPGFGGLPPGPSIMTTHPDFLPPAGALPPNNRSTPPPQQAARSGGSGVPPANEQRMVPDEVIIEIFNTASPQAMNELQRRHRLARIESQTFQLPGTTLYRLQIPDRRSVATVIRALEADRTIASAQPNYLFALQQNDIPPASAGGDRSAREGDAAQYALAKLRLPEAHSIANGDRVLVAVIDSGIDISHPEIAGAIAETFDTLKPPFKPHAHGTAIAGLISGHARLMGSAPTARILAARAFDPAGGSAEATTFNVLRSLDCAAARFAQIINMSFAGPFDPAILRSLDAAHKKGIVLVAAAGNAGPKSPPLYPAADPSVIAVTATDFEDHLFSGSNRGSHIAVAAPGVDILVAVPEGGYQVASGTSYSAAEVSGIVALMLQHNPHLTPDAIRETLMATAKDLGPKGRDDLFGAGLADAYRAITEEAPVSRVSDTIQK